MNERHPIRDAVALLSRLFQHFDAEPKPQFVDPFRKLGKPLRMLYPDSRLTIECIHSTPGPEAFPTPLPWAAHFLGNNLDFCARCAIRLAGFGEYLAPLGVPCPQSRVLDDVMGRVGETASR